MTENNSKNDIENKIDDMEEMLEFTEAPRFNSISIFPSFYQYSSLNENKTKIILESKSECKLIKNFTLHLDIPELVDWVRR